MHAGPGNLAVTAIACTALSIRTVVSVPQPLPYQTTTTSVDGLPPGLNANGRAMVGAPGKSSEGPGMRTRVSRPDRSTTSTVPARKLCVASPGIGDMSTRAVGDAMPTEDGADGIGLVIEAGGTEL